MILLVIAVVGLVTGGVIASQVITDPFGMMSLMPIGMVGFFAALGLLAHRNAPLAREARARLS